MALAHAVLCESKLYWREMVLSLSCFCCHVFTEGACLLNYLHKYLADSAAGSKQLYLSGKCGF